MLDQKCHGAQFLLQSLERVEITAADPRGRLHQAGEACFDFFGRRVQKRVAQSRDFFARKIRIRTHRR